MKSPFFTILLATSFLFFSFDRAVCKYSSSNHSESTESITTLEAHEKKLASTENKIPHSTISQADSEEHSFNEVFGCSGYCHNHNHCHCKDLPRKSHSLRSSNNKKSTITHKLSYFRVIASEVFRPPIA